MTKRRRILSTFTLVMITIGSVDSIRNLPSTALFGTTLIFFFVLAAICFLIPSALVSAELSSSWPKQGGVYVWVREAFGIPAGYMAIWFQWIENVFWYPTILSFIAATLAFTFDPTLAANKYFLVAVILVSFWTITLVNLFGMRSSAFISNFCAVTGLVIPMTLIIILGFAWVFTHHPVQLNFTVRDTLPSLHMSNVWVALTGIVLSFCGMEIATVHARDVKDPQSAFPKALLISVAIILVTLILGSLTIAEVLPRSHISLVAGIMQVFTTFFNQYHLHWIIPIIGVLLIFGGLGGVNNWIIAPTKGLLVAAQDGVLPPIFQKENRFYAPRNLLLAQGVIVTILAMAFLFLPTINESYWLLNVLASQLYMMMYILMFAAGIYLRFKHPNHYRPYKIPGGRLGMVVVAGLGILSGILTICVGFFPPTSLHIQDVFEYESLIAIGLFVMIILPIISYKLRKPSWTPGQS